MSAKIAIHYILSSVMFATSAQSIIALLAITIVSVLHVLLDIHLKMGIAIPAVLEDALNQAAISILEFAPAAQLSSPLTPSTMSAFLARSLTA
jgi:hypothetical protein